jgi:methionine-rich copper-binding protein CopC
VDSVLKSVKRIVADDTDAAFVGGASWFSQVQTPLTTSAPDAIALSTIVPADEATEVVASANIVITFNNKIASDYVFVTKLADSSIVSVVKSYDTTGKILTINPAENLTAGAEYQVNVIGLIDVYGQTLAAVTKTFTVAS